MTLDDFKARYRDLEVQKSRAGSDEGSYSFVYGGRVRGHVTVERKRERLVVIGIRLYTGSDDMRRIFDGCGLPIQNPQWC